MPALRCSPTHTVVTTVTPFVALLLTMALLLGACTKANEEPTTAELLAEIEGRALSAAEVQEREEVAQLLCGLNDEVLELIWATLKPAQLEFQDFVFGRQCQTRSQLYAEATGRFKVTGETTTTRG